MVGNAHHSVLQADLCLLISESCGVGRIIMSQTLSQETTQWLIAKGYNPEELNQPGENGDTALMKATREGIYAVVKELIDAGADINARNSDASSGLRLRNNALWFACFGNHYDLINLLVANNINIDNQNDNGATVRSSERRKPPLRLLFNVCSISRKDRGRQVTSTISS